MRSGQGRLQASLAVGSRASTIRVVWRMAALKCHYPTLARARVLSLSLVQLN
jgi:hypothetical protein